LNDLTKANEAKDRLAAKLNASKPERVTIAADLNITKAEKEQASAEKDQVVAKKTAAIE
jgi:hypothetical protein